MFIKKLIKLLTGKNDADQPQHNPNKHYEDCAPIQTDPSSSTYREDMIENHRRLWRWIAHQSAFERQKISKLDYFIRYNTRWPHHLENKCFLCEYVKNISVDNELDCNLCPLNWKLGDCSSNPDSYFSKWCALYSTAWNQAYLYAMKISELEEKLINKEE